jgi:two-component system, OmpR family, sensor histidine kinase SenX3
LVFSLGYMSLVFAFLRIAKIASVRLGNKIEDWSARIKANPKNTVPMERPPFAELYPLKTALEGLNAQIEQFERTATDKAKLLILRGIAHDLLTPVSQLQLNLATLECRLDSKEHAEILADIMCSLKKVTGIASQVKTLREPVRNESIELVSTALSEVKALRETEEIKSKSLKLEFDSKLESVSCPFSQTDLSRIIANLVQNAADASSNGNTINVNVGTKDGMATLSVQDQGKGIPPSAKDRVFDPEFTLKTGTGTGLGLAVVKYICDKRAAKIDLQSELNQGTTVTIHAPIPGVAHV